MFFDAPYQRHSSKTYFDFRINPRRESLNIALFLTFPSLYSPKLGRCRLLVWVSVGVEVCIFDRLNMMITCQFTVVVG